MCYILPMKNIAVFLLFALFSFSAFAHKAQKQSESLVPETLTQKWLECEEATDEEYQKRYEDFYAEVKKAVPSDTVIYYFPQAKVIYENSLDGIKASFYSNFDDTRAVDESIVRIIKTGGYEPAESVANVDIGPQFRHHVGVNVAEGTVNDMSAAIEEAATQWNTFVEEANAK